MTKKLDYMSKYKWMEEVKYHGECVVILGHQEKGVYMIKYPDGAIVANVLETELEAVNNG